MSYQSQPPSSRSYHGSDYSPLAQLRPTAPNLVSVNGTGHQDDVPFSRLSRELEGIRIGPLDTSHDVFWMTPVRVGQVGTDRLPEPNRHQPILPDRTKRPNLNFYKINFPSQCQHTASSPNGPNGPGSGTPIFEQAQGPSRPASGFAQNPHPPKNSIVTWLLLAAALCATTGIVAAAGGLTTLAILSLVGVYILLTAVSYKAQYGEHALAVFIYGLGAAVHFGLTR